MKHIYNAKSISNKAFVKALIIISIILSMLIAMFVGTAFTVDPVFADDGAYYYDQSGTETIGAEFYFDYTKAYQVLDLVNEERRAVGLSELKMDPDLLDAAMRRAAESAIYFSHTRPDGRTCFTISGKMSGENIAYGSSTAKGTMNQWMNSQGHKENILTPGYTTIGIGCAEINGRAYWSQAFGYTAIEASYPKPADRYQVVDIPFPTRSNSIIDNGTEVEYVFEPLIYVSSDSGEGYFYSMGDDPIYVQLNYPERIGLGLNGIKLNDEDITWEVEDKEIANVEFHRENGGQYGEDMTEIEGLSPGTTKITARTSAGTARATADVTVFDFIRLYGQDRYATSIEVANAMDAGSGFDAVVIAYGGNFADALSGTYLAGLIEAPMILVDKNHESSVINYVNSKLKSGGRVYILGGTGVVSQNVEDRLSGYRVKRLWGQDRYGTNLAILKETDAILQSQIDAITNSGAGANVPIVRGDLLVCSGKGFADSLSSSSARRPIMLVSGSLTAAQKDYLGTGGFNFTIIGGTSAVSQAVEDSLGYYGKIERVGGKDRFETSEMVARHFFSSDVEDAVLVYSNNFPDGLSGGPLGFMIDAPIILANTNKINHAVNYCMDNDIRSIVVIGGPILISDDAAIQCVIW